MKRMCRSVVLFFGVVLGGMSLFAMGGCATANDSLPGRALSTTGTSAYFGDDTWTRSGNRPGSQAAFRGDGFQKQADGQFRDMGVVLPLFNEKGNIVMGPTITTTVTDKEGGTTVTEERYPASLNVYTSDPSNGVVEGFLANLPGGFSLKIDKAGFDNSSVITAYNEQIIRSLEAAEKITAEQAAVARAGIAAGQSVLDALTSAGVKLLSGGVVP